MVWKPLKFPPPDSVRIVLAGKRIRRKQYGIARCSVAGQPAIAVKAGRERIIETRENVVTWLSERGLSKDEAEAFVYEGLDVWDERIS